MTKYLTILKFAIVLLAFSNASSAKNYKNSYKPPQQQLYQEKNVKHPYTHQPFIAENGSYRGQISERTNRLKNTYVHGYKRKDGTYVRGHYRSKKRK